VGTAVACRVPTTHGSPRLAGDDRRVQSTAGVRDVAAAA
jgi:hypothetical protein